MSGKSEMIISKNDEFSKTHTQVIKGIAIVMMLIHHCFLDEGRYGGMGVIFKPFSEELTVLLAAFFKICVGIFVFITAYGITMKMKKMSKEYDISRKDQIKMTINRYISLMAGFLFIFVISAIFCFIMDKGHLKAYANDNVLNEIQYFILDGLGIASLFGTPTLNGTWWYMSLAIVIIALIPLIIKMYNKYGFIVSSVVIFFVTHTFAIDNFNMTRWIFTVLLGIVVADKNILVRLKNLKLFGIKNTNINKCIKFVINTAILVLLVYLRQKMDDTLFEFKDGFIPFFVIYYCYEFITPLKYVSNVFAYLGKHSMNIFLLHTFIRSTYFKSFTYSFKYPLIIVLVLLILSLGVSIIFVDKLKEKVDILMC